AEDGIRDFHVTGVQTCALPIYSVMASSVATMRAGEVPAKVARNMPVFLPCSVTDNPPCRPLITARRFALLTVKRVPAGATSDSKIGRASWREKWSNPYASGRVR